MVVVIVIVVVVVVVVVIVVVLLLFLVVVVVILFPGLGRGARERHTLGAQGLEQAGGTRRQRRTQRRQRLRASQA